MDNGFGMGTLILVGLGCGALGFISGVEGPAIEPVETEPNTDGKPPTAGITRRSAKRVKQWVHDVKANRQTKKAAKQAEKAKVATPVDTATIADIAQDLATTLEDPEVVDELANSQKSRADLIGAIMEELARKAKAAEIAKRREATD